MPNGHATHSKRSLSVPLILCHPGLLDFAAHPPCSTWYICVSILKQEIEETDTHAGIQYLPFAVNKLEGECFHASPCSGCPRSWLIVFSACIQLFNVVDHVQPVPLA
jgi:hypothetical protein